MKKNVFYTFLLFAGTIVILYVIFEKGKPGRTEEETVLLSDTTVEIPAGPSTFPALLVRRNLNDTSSVPLRMSGLKMDVKVIGNIAVSTMEMTFYNDLDRVLEGQLCFPLGEGQTISGFGLETNGVMRDGVVVEKAKGRQVFESVVRRNIDPGLVEWTKGNNFKTRVYPIPAHGTKRVRVSFEQELISAGRSFVYLQPMLFKDKIDNFSLRAEIVQQSVQPHLPENAVSLQFDKWNNSWVAEKTEKDFEAGKPLSFEIPKTEDMQRVFVENTGDDSYFYFTLDPNKYARPKKAPASICLLWDVSGSGTKREVEKEKEILDAYFKKLQNVKIKLVTFSNEIHQEADFTVSSGNWQSLRTELDKQAFDGGTQYGAVDLKKYSADEILLCSDGLSNFGDRDMKLSGIPVTAISSAQAVDHSMLKYIAQATGGHYINTLALSASEAANLLSTESYRFLNATINAGEVSQLYPSLPTDFSRTFSMAGKMQGDAAEVTLNFGFGAEKVYSKKIMINNDASLKDGLVKKLWAQKKISELDVRYERNKAEITALGKECSIVTRNTSLLVLDQLEDYIRYHVAPPQKNWQEKYYAAIKDEEQTTHAQKVDHIETVVAAFRERVDWWSKNFVMKKTEQKSPASIREGVSYLSPAVSDTTRYYDVATAGEDTFRTYRGNIFATAVADSTVTVLNASASTASGWSSAMTQNQAPYTEQETGPGAVNISHDLDPSYTYSWDGTSTAANQQGLNYTASGTYSVMVTDANGATASNSAAQHINIPAAQKALDSEIELKTWDPKTPYMDKLRKADQKELYTTYLSLRKEYEDQPVFFLDAGTFIIEKGDRVNGLRVLSNLAEFDTEENHKILRVLAHKLQQAGFTDLAITTFKDILKLREEEPQSYRDLGLALAEKKDYQGAADMLCKVVNRSWDGRFPDVEVLAANEINTLIATCGTKLKLDSLDKRLIKAMPVDVRIVINWDSDNCDMDLWVTDPAGETCKYDHPETESGGKISRDFTGGYGPEEFFVKKARNGKYKVQVNYFGSREQTLLGPTTVQAELYTNYGKPGQKKKEITLRLTENKEVIDIGELAFGK
jgi:hypothetical protein